MLKKIEYDNMIYIYVCWSIKTHQLIHICHRRLHYCLFAKLKVTTDKQFQTERETNNKVRVNLKNKQDRQKNQYVCMFGSYQNLVNMIELGSKSLMKYDKHEWL